MASMLASLPANDGVVMRKLSNWFLTALFFSTFATAAPSYAQTRRVEQTHPSITYTGNWQTIAHPYVSGGTIAASKQAGARASIAFNGTGIAWIGYYCPCAGVAQISLDGTAVNFARDTWAAVQNPQALIYQFSNLADGPHVLTIEVTGQRFSSANDSYIGIDAFDIGPQDPVRPTVTLTAPAEGAVVTGAVTFSAQASDNIGVRKLAFYADNHFLGEDWTAPYSITVDTGRAPHGESYLVRAVAYDAVNSGEDTATVTVYQNGNTDVTKPFVEMTGATSAPGTATVTADGYYNVGIVRVDFLASTYPWVTEYMLVGSDTTPPYSITRNTSGLPAGRQYHVIARAYDAAGNSFQSVVGKYVTIQQ